MESVLKPRSNVSRKVLPTNTFVVEVTTCTSCPRRRRRQSIAPILPLMRCAQRICHSNFLSSWIPLDLLPSPDTIPCASLPRFLSGLGPRPSRPFLDGPLADHTNFDSCIPFPFFSLFPLLSFRSLLDRLVLSPGFSCFLFPFLFSPVRSRWLPNCLPSYFSRLSALTFLVSLHITTRGRRSSSACPAPCHHPFPRLFPAIALSPWPFWRPLASLFSSYVIRSHCHRPPVTGHLFVPVSVLRFLYALFSPFFTLCKPIPCSLSHRLVLLFVCLPLSGVLLLCPDAIMSS